MKFLSKLEKAKDTWFLIIVSFLFVLLRIPSIFEPLWYGDEGVYETVGMGLNSGRLLYHDIWDNKPPLLYVVYAIFQSNQSLVRIANIGAGLLSVILFFFLVKKLFNKRHIHYITTSLFGFLLALPLLEGNIANAENFIMPFTLAAGLLIVSIKDNAKKHTSTTKYMSLHAIMQNTSYKILFAAGIILGLAFLFKIVALFDFAAFAVFLFCIKTKRTTLVEIRSSFFELIPLVIGFVIPLFCTICYFAFHQALSDFIQSAFLGNISYVNYGNENTLPKTLQLIPHELFIIKTLILLVFCGFLFRQRHRLMSTELFIVTWFSFSLYNALFSQRPYTHYLLVLLASFCLLVGLVFKRNKTQLIAMVTVVLITLYVAVTFPYSRKNVAYYRNFISFIRGNESIQSYRAFFDSNTPTDYAVADFLLTRLQNHDTIFIWGNNAQLYPLTHTLPPGKYTVAYHITMNRDSIQQTAKAIAQSNPQFVVVMPNVGSFPYRLTNFSQGLTINHVVIYERNN